MSKYRKSKLSDCHCEPTYHSYPENKRFVSTAPFITVNGYTCYGMYLPKPFLTKEEKVIMKQSGKANICKICGKPCKHLMFELYKND